MKSLQALEENSGNRAEGKWGVKNRGLCLLIAWTNEILAAGTDWQPRPMGGVEFP